MIQIALKKISKRYRQEWIFRKVNYTFEQGKSYAILGPNGSGKSTFLKSISGHLTPTKGKITYTDNQQPIDKGDIYRQISYAAPYIQLIEELTLQEAIEFHQQFKPFIKGIDSKFIIDLLQFQKSAKKEIRFFSSGMKQRLKLVLSFLSDSQILLLDEPTTNLDTEGIQWYRQLVKQYHNNRLLVIASNVEVDYNFCDQQINILDYK